MSRILLLFASSHGQTAKIAASLADTWKQFGHDVVCQDVTRAAPPSPAGFDVVVLGSRVQFGRHSRRLRRYVVRHAGALNATRSAFFSVSMSAARPDGQQTAQDYVDAFLEHTGWKPREQALFGGGLPYTHYGHVMRFVMRSINGRQGSSTDTSRDHEYTDWGAVQAFARRLLPPAAYAWHGAGKEVHA